MVPASRGDGGAEGRVVRKLGRAVPERTVPKLSAPQSYLLIRICVMCLWCESAETLQVRRRVSVSSPVKPGIPDRSRPSCLEEEPEGEVENGELLVAVARLPQGVPERETEKERPGRG